MRIASAVVFLAAAAANAQDEPKPAPTIASLTEGAERLDGFVDLRWQAAKGMLWLELDEDRLGEDLLWSVALATGLGSNPVGLDRGALGASHVVAFERVGPRLLLVARNLRYRAQSDDAAERAAVAESFAPSVLWGFEIAGRGRRRRGRVHHRGVRRYLGVH